MDENKRPNQHQENIILKYTYMHTIKFSYTADGNYKLVKSLWKAKLNSVTADCAFKYRQIKM